MLMFGDRRPWGRDRWDYLGYTPKKRGPDQRVYYHNPSIPWILGVHAFAVPWHFARSGDGAHFAFPPGTQPGRYIAYYMWAGYRDCVDIDVLPDEKPVTDVYGYRPPGALNPMRKIDHCQYVDGMYDILAEEEAECNQADGTVHPDPGWATCFAIPPAGKLNSRGETADEALAACNQRCQRAVPGRRYLKAWSFRHKRFYRRGAWCSGMNVVPLDPCVDCNGSNPRARRLDPRPSLCRLTESSAHHSIPPRARAHACMQATGHEIQQRAEHPVGIRWVRPQLLRQRAGRFVHLLSATRAIACVC